MPIYKNIAELKENPEELCNLCKQREEPVILVRDGIGDIVMMNIEAYARQQSLISSLAKAVPDTYPTQLKDGEDLLETARRLREAAGMEDV